METEEEEDVIEETEEIELEPMFPDEELEPVAEEVTEETPEEVLEETTTEMIEKSAPKKLATLQGDQISIRYFYDYAAPNIAQTEALVAKLGAKFGRSVLWIYRPLGSFGASGYAAKASECGLMQGAWPAFHDALVTLEGNVTERNVKTLVREYGLGEAKFDTCMADAKIDVRLRHYQREADNLAIESIPAFVIGEDVVFSGNYPPVVFEQMIESLLKTRLR